jgi:long-chain acyl-CoA synthetase
MLTLCDLLRAFPTWGERPALCYRTGVRRFVFSYASLYDLSLRMNSFLAGRGIDKGDRILLWAPNSPWWAAAFWGCVARGAVVVPVDFMSGVERASTILRISEARLVIQSRLKPDILAGVPSCFAEDLQYVLPGIDPVSPAMDTVPDDMAELVYTSGTTGTPKGVILTHGNLMANLHQVNGHLPIVGPEYVFLSLLPLSHLFEQMGGFLTPLYRGAAIVHIRTLKPSAILAALREEDIRAVICVPRLLQLLKGSIERELESKHVGGLFRRLLQGGDRMPLLLRKLLFLPIRRRFGRHFVLFVSGGAALAPELFRFWSILGFAVVEGYGLTECAPVLTANTMERRVAGSVGKALPGVEIRIENGEILARGRNVFPGYYKNESATREAFTRDGWFRTGDLGRIDEQGDLRVLGRGKELIVTGAGINVYPDELENILNALAGVREACVIGLDRGSGEEVHAVLLLDGSGRRPDEILLEANGKLDPLHRITGFSLWHEPEFPKTTTLKIRKFLVKQRISQGDESGEPMSVDPLVNLIARITECPNRDIREDSSLVIDLGLTSIGALELVNCIEQEYRLDLEDSLIGPATTVTDLRRVIARRERPEEARRLRFWTSSRFLRVARRVLDAVFHAPLFRTFVTLRVSGLENLTHLESPVMFISNHQSYLDQPAILFSLPPHWRYATATAAWEEFFFRNYRTWQGRVWKRFTYEYGTLFLNLFPLSQTGGFRRSLAHMGRLADHRLNILLFPEGARSEDGRLLPFRQGIGVMVRELSVPVAPVRILGMEKVMPRGAAWPRRGTVEVRFGTPLVFGRETPEEIVEQARKAVEELG